MAKMMKEDGEPSTGKFIPAAMKFDEELPELHVDEEENKRKKKKKKKTKKKKKETIDVTIETIGERPDKISPLIGYFPSGFDPLKVNSTKPKSEEEDWSPDPPPKHRVRIFRHEKRTSRLELVVSPNGSPVDFVGTSYSGEATAGQVCTYALGVLDKETQILKIVPIAANKIFRLEPRVRGSDLSENEPSNMLMLMEEKKTESKADKRRDVTLLYGSKAAINRDKKFKSLQQKDDPRSKKDLDKKIEEVKIYKEALECAHTYNSLNIPPHDISATTPQMAYPLDKIIFKGERNYLLDIFELSQVGEKVAADDYPSFVRNRVHKLEETEDHAEKKTLACILSYITHLIKFKEKRSIDGVSSSKNTRIPDILYHKFMAMFTDTESQQLSDDKRDLLISYILVLTLFADDFQTDPLDIALDLRMTSRALRQHFEHLGCKLVREGKLLLATLPVPLKFPELRVKRRRQ